jgi:hypothetical protein
MRAVPLLAALIFTCGFSICTAQEKPERRPQHETASKEAPATVRENSESVQKAIDARNLPAARKMLEKTAAFSGEVSALYEPKGNGLAILNFAKNYREAVSAVVDHRDFSKFPVLKQLVGKRVLFTGRVVEYKDRLEVQLTDPKNLAVIVK